MASDPTPLIKQQWMLTLQPLMPLITDSGERVPVTYAYPGDVLVAKEAVFFHGAETGYERHSLKAGRVRRMISPGFDVIVQVRQPGPSNNDEVVEESPQYLCDTKCHEIWQVIDEQLADDKQMSSSAEVDVAWVESTRLEYGTYEHGVWTRLIARVRFNARFL